MKKILPIVFIMSLFLGCHGQQGQIDFFNKNLIELKKDKTYQEVKKASYDTLNSWINTGIKAAGIPPLRAEFEFKFDDAIFFNTKKNRCILMILARDSLGNATLDMIQLMFGNYENNRWDFYFKSLPTIYFSRKMYNTTEPLSFNKLSELGRALIIKEYYKKLSFKINEAFFNYDMNILKQMHTDFLNDK